MAERASDTGPGGRRAYDSPVRRARAAETRERIVAAGADLAHELSSWDWRALTFRAVAERAGVGERTVYRHFPTERHLHDAVMQRLNELAGVDYEAVGLHDVGALAARVFRSLHRFAAGQTVAVPDEETFLDMDARRRAALLQAVEAERPGWTARQREDVAAALDVLWHVPSYERLTGAWSMDGERATEVIGWLIAAVVEAVDADRPPPG